jgi:hypothetical protein
MVILITTNRQRMFAVNEKLKKSLLPVNSSLFLGIKNVSFLIISILRNIVCYLF